MTESQSTTQSNVPVCVRMNVTIEDVKQYAAWVHETVPTWNGWVQPAFELGVAQAIAEDMGGVYNEETREFMFAGCTGEMSVDLEDNEIYGCEYVQDASGDLHLVWAIGAGMWVWQEFDDGEHQMDRQEAERQKRGYVESYDDGATVDERNMAEMVNALIDARARRQE